MKRIALHLVLILAFILLTGLLAAVEVTVGNGDQQAPLPINFQYRTTLYETIYLSNEMNIGGLITGIRFYGNFFESVTNVPINIWLGETLQSNLTDGWILPSQMTHVYSDNASFPAGINDINITFPVPFLYNGANLVMMVQHPWQDDYYMTPNNFYAQTVGDSRSRLAYNSNFSIDPNDPPQTGVTGQFPKTTFIVTVDGMGSITGNVTSGGNPLQDASVTLANTAHVTTTGADGSFSFPYIAPGVYNISVTKLGYTSVLQTITVLEDQSTTLTFDLSLLPLVTVTGHVTGSDNPGVGIAGIQITIGGYAPFTATTDANGYFSIAGVYTGQTYTYTIGADGYQTLEGTVTIGSTNYDMGDIVLPEMAYPPLNATAVEAPDQTSVSITWEAPVVAEEGWIHYDSGENLTGFGTQGASFTVAVRYPPEALTNYAGTSLYAMKVWPNTGAGWNLRVWTGGNATEPGTMVVDQPFVPVLNSYNTILLDNPVPITGTEELWFGYFISGENMSHAHAGVDAGPAVNGFSNMIQWLGNWTTLLAVNTYCDFNWNIQGYVGLTPPDLRRPLTLLPTPAQAESRSLMGYQVSRLLDGQQENPQTWVNLTPQTITATSCVDNGWAALPSGTYLWAVRAVYTGGIVSNWIFTNTIVPPEPFGTITGVISNQDNLPVSGATVTADTFSATTNELGLYILMLWAGTYDVTATHPDYEPVTHNDVTVSESQTVFLDFVFQSVNNSDAEIPAAVTALAGNFPNPFSRSTDIRYSLKEAAEVSISIYNLKGQLVRNLASIQKSLGSHSISWNCKDNSGKAVPGGLYFVRMKAGKHSFTHKMLLMN
jgi:hypothetical protein